MKQSTKWYADGEYGDARRKRRDLRYRLIRRTSEVERAVIQFKGHQVDYLLDIGTYDGLMVEFLRKSINIQLPVGIDNILALARIGSKKVVLLNGDALQLPFSACRFDVIIAAGLIEHIQDPNELLAECYRVLKSEGVLIVTTPDPFWESVATSIGYLKGHHEEKGMYKTFSLRELEKLFAVNRFDVLLARKFMMSPCGFPCEEVIEDMLRAVKLDFIFFNQLIVGRK